MWFVVIGVASTQIAPTICQVEKLPSLHIPVARRDLKEINHFKFDALDYRIFDNLIGEHDWSWNMYAQQVWICFECFHHHDRY